MKKLLVALTVTGIMIGSLATLSAASSRLNSFGFGNRYNGSYYYDLAWGNVTVTGASAKTDVYVYLKKGGEWKAGKKTTCKGSKNGLTYTCYSNSIQGSGSNGARVTRIDY